MEHNPPAEVNAPAHPLRIDTVNGYYCGLGDLCCFAWIGQTLRAKGHEVEFFATGWRGDVLRFFGQRVTEHSAGAVVAEIPWPEAVRDDLACNYLEWIAAQLDLRNLPSLSQPKLDLPPMEREMGHNAAARVLLFPECSTASRTWPRNYWLELARLLQLASIDFAVVTPKRVEAFGPFRCVYEQPLAYVAAMVQMSSLVIGNDSGPVHLAGTIGTKALAIQGPTDARIFDHLNSVECLRQEDLACSGCTFLAPYRDSCFHGCHVLYRTFPEEVFSAAMRMLGEKSDAGRAKPKKGGRK